MAACWDVGAEERDALLRECAAGRRPTDVPPAVAAVVYRYVPVAVVMNDFSEHLQKRSRTTPYPVVELDRAWPEVRRR